MKRDFKIGDRVVLVNAGDYGVNKANPEVNSPYECAGTVIDRGFSWVTVEWDNGDQNDYELADPTWEMQLANMNKLFTSIQTLPTDPKEAAKEVVKQANRQYSRENFKEFRYRTMKEFEDASNNSSN